MNKIRLQDVLDSTGARLVRGAPQAELGGVSTDSRTLTSGELFLALQGPSFDGNRFALTASRGGANALLLRADETGNAPAGIPEETWRQIRDDVAIAVHPDPRRALADLGAWYRSTLSCPVLGITGSCGKTTTKNLLYGLVAPLRRVVASPNSFNNDIGVPHTLFLADRDTQLLTVEMGTNNPGEIAALCRIARLSLY